MVGDAPRLVHAKMAPFIPVTAGVILPLVPILTEKFTLAMAGENPRLAAMKAAMYILDTDGAGHKLDATKMDASIPGTDGAEHKLEPMRASMEALQPPRCYSF